MVHDAVKQNLPMFAIMEDDLMPMGDVREVRAASFRTVRRDDGGGAGRVVHVQMRVRLSKRAAYALGQRWGSDGGVVKL